MSYLLQTEYQIHQLATRKIMLQELFQDSSNSDIAGNVVENQMMEEMKLKVSLPVKRW